MQNIDVIKLSKNAIKNSYINISPIINLFPNDCIGGTNKADHAKKQITLDWDNGESIKSDIASDKKIIRDRSWAKKFIVKFNLKEKDLVAFERTSTFNYKVYPLKTKRVQSDNRVIKHGKQLTFMDSVISYNPSAKFWEIDSKKIGSISSLSMFLADKYKIQSFNYCTHPIGSILEQNGYVFGKPFGSSKMIKPVLCSSTEELEKQVENLLSSIQNKIPIGQEVPKKSNVSTSSYTRDAAVVAYVLDLAQGICECCNNKAPFLKNGGLPFLEVHHVQQLSENGGDTINNAVAVCPNCHRELHFGERRQNLTKFLYTKVERLKKTT